MDKTNCVYRWRKMAQMCLVIVIVISITSVSIAQVHMTGDNRLGLRSVQINNQIISKAIHAPFVAFANKDARRLCDLFTPLAVRRLAYHQCGLSCESRVSNTFLSAKPIDKKLAWRVANAIELVKIIIKQRIAHVLMRFGLHGSMLTLVLRRIGGEWRIATVPILALTTGCTKDRARCQRNSRAVIFGFAEHVIAG